MKRCPELMRGIGQELVLQPVIFLQLPVQLGVFLRIAEITLEPISGKTDNCRYNIRWIKEAAGSASGLNSTPKHTGKNSDCGKEQKDGILLFLQDHLHNLPDHTRHGQQVQYRE
ncbi:hypothetical protein D3C75_1091970 [compost metagenome]